ncbi:MAG TPA: hypothetical protein VNI84_00215 [Pyrinomonadaceae bacterium]|nr:hypothetical protein [Pyrinomonadaceae bacterium]
MKTAISVSDDVFELSEKLAKKLKVSRSKVFALGVQKLAEEHDGKELIAQINRVCEETDTSLDPFWKKAQSRILPKNEW